MAKATKARTTPQWADGFVEVAATPKQRLIGLSYGEFGTGKSALALGGPGPIAVYDFDEGMEGVAEDFRAEKEILIRQVSWNPNDEDAQEAAVTVRNEFFESFQQAIAHARTVIIDKGSQLWEIVRYAEFGAPSGQPRDYYPLNKFMTKLFSLAKQGDANFFMIDGMKDVWGAGKANGDGKKALTNTGNRTRRGFDEAGELAHIVLFHEKEGDDFQYTVQKSRGPGAHEIQGQSFLVANDPEAKLGAFRELARRVFPDTEDSDWQ